MKKILVITILMIAALYYAGNLAEGWFQTVYAKQDIQNSKAIQILFGK